MFTVNLEGATTTYTAIETAKNAARVASEHFSGIMSVLDAAGNLVAQFKSGSQIFL